MYIYMYMYICIYVYMYKCIYVYVYMYIIYIYICACAYVNVYYICINMVSICDFNSDGIGWREIYIMSWNQVFPPWFLFHFCSPLGFRADFPIPVGDCWWFLVSHPRNGSTEQVLIKLVGYLLVPHGTWGTNTTQIAIWIGKMMINHQIWWVFPRNFSAQARWFQCSASHPPSNHQANGAQHEATDAQGLRVEALDQQRAQRRGVAQHDDQRHGSRLESQNGGQQHALRNFFNFNRLVQLGKSKRKSLRI